MIALTDPAPYSELAAQTPEDVRALAYKSRQDYQNLQNQVVVYKALHASASRGAAADAEFLQLLPDEHRERRGYAWEFHRDGDAEFPDLPRGEGAWR